MDNDGRNTLSRRRFLQVAGGAAAFAALDWKSTLANSLEQAIEFEFNIQDGVHYYGSREKPLNRTTLAIVQDALKRSKEAQKHGQGKIEIVIGQKQHEETAVHNDIVLQNQLEAAEIFARTGTDSNKTGVAQVFCVEDDMLEEQMYDVPQSQNVMGRSVIPFKYSNKLTFDWGTGRDWSIVQEMVKATTISLSEDEKNIFIHRAYENANRKVINKVEIFGDDKPLGIQDLIALWEAREIDDDVPFASPIDKRLEFLIHGDLWKRLGPEGTNFLQKHIAIANDELDHNKVGVHATLAQIIAFDPEIFDYMKRLGTSIGQHPVRMKILDRKMGRGDNKELSNQNDYLQKITGRWKIHDDQKDTNFGYIPEKDINWAIIHELGHYLFFLPHNNGSLDREIILRDGTKIPAQQINYTTSYLMYGGGDKLHPRFVYGLKHLRNQGVVNYADFVTDYKDQLWGEKPEKNAIYFKDYEGRPLIVDATVYPCGEDMQIIEDISWSLSGHNGMQINWSSVVEEVTAAHPDMRVVEFLIVLKTPQGTIPFFLTEQILNTVAIAQGKEATYEIRFSPEALACKHVGRIFESFGNPESTMGGEWVPYVDLTIRDLDETFQYFRQ